MHWGKNATRTKEQRRPCWAGSWTWMGAPASCPCAWYLFPTTSTHHTNVVRCRGLAADPQRREVDMIVVENAHSRDGRGLATKLPWDCVALGWTPVHLAMKIRVCGIITDRRAGHCCDDCWTPVHLSLGPKRLAMTPSTIHRYSDARTRCR